MDHHCFKAYCIQYLMMIEEQLLSRLHGTLPKKYFAETTLCRNHTLLKLHFAENCFRMRHFAEHLKLVFNMQNVLDTHYNCLCHNIPFLLYFLKQSKDFLFYGSIEMILFGKGVIPLGLLPISSTPTSSTLLKKNIFDTNSLSFS